MAAQGVEAQSVANCYTAIEQGLEVLPVLNKLDLPQADPDRVVKEIEEIIGIDASHAVRVSAKRGDGIKELLEMLIDVIPPPADRRSESLPHERAWRHGWQRHPVNTPFHDF